MDVEDARFRLYNPDQTAYDLRIKKMILRRKLPR
jgi:hypothetical protein